MNKINAILFLDNTFNFGGAINSLCYLLSALDRSKFEPVLVTGQSAEFLSEHIDCNCYHFVPKLPWLNNKVFKKISRFPLFRLRLPRKALSLCRLIYWMIFVYIAEAFKYFRLGRKHRVSIVHLNNIPSTQFAGILAAKLLGVPCVAHHRDFEEIHPITRVYARLVDHHVAISRAVRDNLLQLGVPPERITIVHDALDPARFDPSSERAAVGAEFGLAPGQPVFGIFGRIAEWKGVREFLHGARQVIDEVPSAVGFVVGGAADGEENFLPAMKQLAVDLGLEGKVIFTGYRKDVAALMGFMDVVVHASIRPEPFGMVIIEGMAMGKPVVATRGGGALDIVLDGENGFLVEIGDAAALGGAIGTLLRHPELRIKMGSVGRQRVDQFFSSRRYAEQMAVVYQQLLGADRF